MSLGRIDNNKGYCPENCRWENYKQQARNTTTNRFLNYNGQTKTISEWAEELGFKPSGILYDRINRRGWDVVRALTTPPCLKHCRKS